MNFLDFRESGGYWTSSKTVKEIVKIYGIPDYVYVLKTFQDGKSAFDYETRLLRKLNCRDDARSLNKHNNEGSNVLSTRNKRMFRKAIDYFSNKITVHKEDKRFQTGEISHIMLYDIYGLKRDFAFSIVKRFKERRLSSSKEVCPDASSF